MVIYKITNTLNGKIYIGQTKQKIEKRFLQHFYSYSPLGRAMRQCGIENFTIEIIEECESQQELTEREKFWIKVLKSKIPNGYNQNDGGGISLKNAKIFSIDDISTIKTFSVKEVADYLGVNKCTVQRYIQDGKLTTIIDSKKQGYRITEQSLIDYAKSHKSKLDNVLKKDLALTSISAVTSFLPILGTVVTDLMSTMKSLSNNKEILNDPVIIEKFIKRLNVELEDFDSQIQFLQFQISHAKTDKEKSSYETKFFQLQKQRIQIKKDITDLEIREAFLESTQNKKDTEDR